MIVAWTGHRPALFRDPAEASAAVDFVARDLLAHENVTRFQVGGQRGVDTWAAQAAIDTGISFSLLLPLDIDAFTAETIAFARQAPHSVPVREVVLAASASAASARGRGI